MRQRDRRDNGVMLERLRRPVATLGLLLIAVGAVLAALVPVASLAEEEQQPAAGTSVLVTDVDGPIAPVVTAHLESAMEETQAAGHEALVVRLNTPGGLADVTNEITTSFLNAPVPVIVYVAPSGARAGSAGAFITAAGHVAAMAPGTNIGAATPIDGATGEDLDRKIIEDSAAQIAAIAEQRDRNIDFYRETVVDGRSVTDSEALEVDAIDVVAESEADLLGQVDGLTVSVGEDDVTLDTDDATPVEYDMSLTRELLHTLANPTIAFALVSIGTLALIYELANPGAIIPGVLGAVLLLVGWFSLNALPFNIAGLLLLVVALGLFIAEIFAPGVGVFAGGGAIALVAAAIFLFDEPTGIGVDLSFIVPIALAIALIVVFIGRVAWTSLKRNPWEGLGSGTGTVGARARVRTVDGDRLWVILADSGDRWQARPSDGARLEPGDEVQVVEQDGMVLVVSPADPRPADSSRR